MTDTHRSITRNSLIRGLPQRDRDRLAGAGEVMALRARQQLIVPDREIRSVYFPLNGVVSLVAVVDGQGQRLIEVATIGNEGFVGMPVFLGAASTPGMAFSQIPGEALCVPVKAFRAESAPGSALYHLVQRYAQALFNQISQSAACNRAHPVEQRCCRWLLMSHDRVGMDVFPLTQEFLAQMLGVRRASVTEVAGRLQAARLIEYRRGVVTILDRRGLERTACPCYAIIRDEHLRLTPPATARSRSLRAPGIAADRGRRRR